MLTRLRRRVRLALAGTLLVALALGTSASALAGARTVFEGSLVGLPVAGESLFGVAGGGVTWDITEGHATLTSDGHLSLQVHGLVLSTTHSNPIPTGRAIVACAGAAVASSDAVAFSTSGDAQVNAQLAIPSPCLAPTVFFAGITGAGDRWFAVTGL